jgi:tetrahydromethanopterin S-methyltransferase subunit B
MTKEKIKAILDRIDTLQEQLLSLPDDMLLSIDPRTNLLSVPPSWQNR